MMDVDSVHRPVDIEGYGQGVHFSTPGQDFKLPAFKLYSFTLACIQLL